MPPEPSVTPPAPARSRWSRLLPLAAIAGMAVFGFAMGWHRAISLETLVQRRADLEAFVAGRYAFALASYVGIYVTAVALSIPGAVFLTMAGGVMFGWFAGGLAAIVGATIGATLLFLIARYALSDLVRRWLGPRLEALAAGFRADAFSYLLLLRLVPVVPFFVVNLAPALIGVRLSHFVAATALGIVPATFAFAASGAGLDSVVGAQAAAYRECLAAGRAGCRLDFEFRAVLTADVLIAVIALVILALVSIILRRWYARRSRTMPPA